MEAVTDFMFLGSGITADGDCCHEIKRHLILGRKEMQKFPIEIVYNINQHCAVLSRSVVSDSL